VLALKGVDEFTRSTFMKNMSTKAAEILKDEMEIKGPVKLANVLDAQKRIIVLAKQMNEEEKIILSGKNDPDVVY
jgi:flagellar motor switch protein FliG